MATRIENDRHIPTSVTSFEGKGGLDYEIVTYRSGSEGSFVRKVENNGYSVDTECADLVETVRRLYIAVYPERARRNPTLTDLRIQKGLSYPRTVLELIKHRGVPVGYGIFPRFDIEGEPVLYSSRAIISTHEKEGLGTHILERAIAIHNTAVHRGQHRPLLEGMLMTQKWESIRSLEHLQERGVVDKIQPIGEDYDEQGKRILYGVHAKVFVSSAAIDERGVSKGELREVGMNEVIRFPQEGTRGYEIQQKLVNHPPYGLGLNLAAGDVVYVRFTLPRSIVAAAVSPDQ